MIYTHAAAALLALAVGLAGGWKVQGWRWDAAERSRLEAEAEVQRMRARVALVASSGHEADRVKIRTEFQTIYSEVERVVEKPVYRNVCLDADGLRLIAGAVRGGAAAGESGDPVPGSGGAD